MIGMSFSFSKMLKQTVKVAAIAVGSVVALGYSVAFVLNLLHGWPMKKEKLKRAFHPNKVLKLNYAVLQQLKYLKIVPLILKWKLYYASAYRSRLIQDISYGNNQCLLDLYLPKNHDVNTDRKPIVMFVFGGAWGSGDKSYYGLLCTQIADRLGAVVCCPNYSIYPRGYVDDMIEDLIDCLTWLQNNAVLYGGDKNKVMIMGHSAGSHLCMMAILELALKQYEQDPNGQGGPANESSLAFEEKHFNGNNGAQMEGSYCLIDDVDKSNTTISTKPEDGDEESSVSASYQMVRDNPDLENGEMNDADREDEEVAELMDQSDFNLALPEIELTDAQKRFRDLCQSVKVCIGLSGVYQISDHYQHEYNRGVEDISTMAKAMYGPEHFDRYSPTVIVNNAPSGIRLPPIVLIHGSDDATAPSSSTTKFATALGHLNANVTVDIIPGLTHLDAMMDIMDSEREFHNRIMNIIVQAAQRYL